MSLRRSSALGNGALQVLAILMARRPKRLYTPKDDMHTIMWEQGYQQALHDMETEIKRGT